MLKVRIIGSKNEVSEFVNYLKNHFKVLDISKEYPSKYNRNHVRVYITLQ